MGRGESKAVDVTNRRILKGRGLLRDNTLLGVIHAPVESGEELDLDGFPFDEQFGGHLESGGQLFWTRSAEPGTTTPHCLGFQSAGLYNGMVARVRAEGALGDAVTVEKDESQRTPSLDTEAPPHVRCRLRCSTGSG